MKAAVLRAVGEPLTIEDVELDPPGPGEVHVRIEAAGVCHSDLHYMTGDLPATLPIVVGHEGAGIVEAVGAGDRPARGRAPCRAHLAAALRRVRRLRRRQPRALPLRPRLRRRRTACSTAPPGCTAATERIHHLMGVSCFAERVVVSDDERRAGARRRAARDRGDRRLRGRHRRRRGAERASSAAGRPLAVYGAGGVGLAAVLGAVARRRLADHRDRPRPGRSSSSPASSARPTRSTRRDGGRRRTGARAHRRRACRG